MIALSCGANLAASAEEKSPQEEAVSKISENLTNKCWPGVLDLPHPQRLSVTVKFSVNTDGEFVEMPAIVHLKKQRRTNKNLVIARERALYAVRRCAPYKVPMLEGETEMPITINFNPGVDATS